MGTLRGAAMGWRASLGKMIAAIVFALAGATLAVFVWPQMRRSDLLLRNGVSAEATVVALDADRCFYTNRRTNQGYPCFRATGAWTHDGVAYRSTLGYYKQADEAPLGTTVRIIFAPDPAAAAGAADLQGPRHRRRAESSSVGASRLSGTAGAGRADVCSASDDAVQDVEEAETPGCRAVNIPPGPARTADAASGSRVRLRKPGATSGNRSCRSRSR